MQPDPHAERAVMNNTDLAEALNIPPEYAADISAPKRRTLEHMLHVAEELNAGRVPAGVIVCRPRGRKHTRPHRMADDRGEVGGGG